jgi:hypothetical protein
VNIISFVKYVVYLTGILLFFITIRPFRKQSLYYSMYLLSPVIIFVSWLLDGLFGAILASIFLAILYPSQKAFQQGEYVFYQKFPGFLGSCCTYDVVQNRLLILQRKQAELRITETHNFNQSQFWVANNKGYLRVNLEEEKGSQRTLTKIDTTLVIDFK